MEFLGGNIRKPCDVKAGIKSIKIAKWKSDLFYEKQGNELINIEELDFYKFEVPSINYNTTIDHNDEGESYNINVDFDLYKVTKENASLFNIISELQVIAVLKDEYNRDVVLGLQNGLTPNISETSGGAKTSFTGYNISLTGEQDEQPLFSSLFEPTLSSVLRINEDVLIINDKVLQI